MDDVERAGEDVGAAVAGEVVEDAAAGQVGPPRDQADAWSRRSRTVPGRASSGTARPGSGTAAGPCPGNRRASWRRCSAASGCAGRRATRRDRRRTTRTASREPDGRVWTASAAIGKMQLDGPTQPMQLSCSPRRRALMPSKAVMSARTDVGTPGVLGQLQRLLEPGRRLVMVPLVEGDERELPVDPECLQRLFQRRRRVEMETSRLCSRSCALARSARCEITSRYSSERALVLDLVGELRGRGQDERVEGLRVDEHPGRRTGRCGRVRKCRQRRDSGRRR